MIFYRGAFSLGGNRYIPNIGVNVQIIDVSIFIRPLHINKTNMKRLIHLRILKHDTSPYSSPIMFFARKKLY